VIAIPVRAAREIGTGQRGVIGNQIERQL